MENKIAPVYLFLCSQLFQLSFRICVMEIKLLCKKNKSAAHGPWNYAIKWLHSKNFCFICQVQGNISFNKIVPMHTKMVKEISYGM